MCTQRKRKSDKLCNQVAQSPLSCQTKHVTYFSIHPRIKYCVTCNEFNPTVRLSWTVMRIWEQSNIFLKLWLELFSIFPLSSPSAHSEMFFFFFIWPPPQKKRGYICEWPKGKLGGNTVENKKAKLFISKVLSLHRTLVYYTATLWLNI